jgi:hypothetical protein
MPRGILLHLGLFQLKFKANDVMVVVGRFALVLLDEALCVLKLSLEVL